MSMNGKEWPDWVDEGTFGEYVRDAGGGAAEVATWARWSDGEACLDAVLLAPEDVEQQLDRIRKGECASMCDDLFGGYDKSIAHGTNDPDETMGAFRAAVEEVLTWTPEPAWRAARLERG